MKDYKCPYAVRDGELIKCRKMDGLCGNVYYCRMGGRWKLTEASVKCPKRFEADTPKPVKKRSKKNG